MLLLFFYLNSHFGGHGRIDDGGQLVSREDPERIVLEVENGDEVVVANSL
jgi:hypothetical protein